MINIPKININITNFNKHKKPKHNNKRKLFNYAILIEKRNPKVKTDEHKLFGTKENHKYY